MQIHNLVQGSPEWLEFRAKHHGASEAAAMLGLSKKVKRTELLHIKHTGNPKEFSDWVRANILDYGHEVEALARPLLEEDIGDELYPVTCSEGILSASCDGLTMNEDIAFEHKQWNASLSEAVRAGELPEEYMPQCQQVLMITKADKLIFVCSDGTPENFVSMEVFPDPEWFKRIIAGWAQFDIDLAEYSPKLLAEKPEADAIKTLPALAIMIRGEVINSNLPAFKAAADSFIENINVDLKTDEDFSNAEATVKYCADVEENLALAKKNIIAQTATIEDVMLTIDQVIKQVSGKRLMLDKLVKSKKEQIRESILSGVKLAYAEHVAALELEIKPIRLVYTTPDFAGAMKNKRTLASLHDSVDTLLANAKIATNELAADLRTKMTWVKEAHEGYGFLFMDLQTIIHKQNDDFQLLVNTRVNDHKAAEKKKEDDAREKIRLEEEAKATVKAKAEQDAIAEQKRKDDAEAAAAQMLATQKANAIAGGADPVTINKAESMLDIMKETAPVMASRLASVQESAPTAMAASKHSPVPAKETPQATLALVPTSDSQIIDVLMDVFNWTEAQAIDRLQAFDFTAARSNLAAVAA